VTSGNRSCFWSLPAILFLLTAVYAAWKVNALPIVPCQEQGTSRSNEHKFQAITVVVRPWNGQHHVYGVFRIPQEFKHDRLYSAALSIDGLPANFSAGSPEDEAYDTIAAEYGFYLKRAYIPTRTALWFLVTGRFGDLRTACHWWLVFTEKSL